MGNGCLKPKPRNGDIYIDCINQIYQEVKLIDQLQLNNENIYSLTKQKIQKKGWLRKLMDYLTSHRASIAEAALHNFRLMAQTKGIKFKIAGLIVIDYIINVVLRESGLSIEQKIGLVILDMIIKQKDINAQSFYQQSQNKRQSHEKNSSIRKVNGNIYSVFSQRNIQLKPNQPSTTNVNGESLNSNGSSAMNNQSLLKVNNSQTNSLMLRQIYNVKFSNIYYNMMNSILSIEDGSYLYVVKSIITYTKYNCLKNIQQQKIIDILTILLEHIQTGDQVTYSLKAYQLLLQKLRDSFLQNQIKNLKVFLKIWQESFINANDQQNEFIHKNSQNRYILESIMQKMISLTIGSMFVNKIYEQIIYVYDQHMFENMIHFQEMLITITKKNDLRNQFFRGLYCFLLSYLAVNRAQTQTNKKIGSVKQINNQPHLYINKSNSINNQWPIINSNKNYESFINQYQNIFDYKVKLSVIETLKRWTKSYQFIEINQIIKYNSALLLNTFLFNIHQAYLNENLANSLIRKTQSNHKNFAHHLSNEFCSHFCFNAEIQQRISLVNLLYDQIKIAQVQQIEKSLYIDMINQLIYQDWIESSKIVQFCHVDLAYSSSINIELISQANILINKFTEKMLSQQIDQIAYFLFSVFEYISKVSISYHQFIATVNSSIKLVQTIQRSKGSLIVLAFTQRMIKAVSNQMEKQNFFISWDLILNCVYILLSSPRNHKRQNNKKQLNDTYVKLTHNQQLKSNLNKITAQEFDQKVQKILVGVFGQLSQVQQQQNLLRFQLPKSQDFQAPNGHSSNQKIYEVASIAFRDIFCRGVSMAKGSFLNYNYQQGVNMQSTNNGFSRMNSIVRQQDIGHQQKSIADVMDMINL